MDAKTESEIKELFSKDLKRSIYPIAQKYGCKWSEVVEIREPMLTKANYEYKRPYVYHVGTKERVADWRGGKMTEAMAKQIAELLNSGNSDRSIKARLRISNDDLVLFIANTRNCSSTNTVLMV